jgi:putative cardiolipin synthase
MKHGQLRGTSLLFLALGLSANLLAACALPPLEQRIPSSLFVDGDTTQLGKAIAPYVAAHPEKSGIYPLFDSHAAFAARMLLAQAAERVLDIQCYIWKKDLSGTLLFEALHQAADRGVRVRLLLDDNNTFGLDPTLAALDAHPNLEVRLFNPVAIRSPRWLGYVTDFPRLNRRMHNKAFTADNQITIVGGRNVGDEYFGATDDVLFVDLDVMAAGPVVQEVANNFNRYWDSASSYPVDQLFPPVDSDPLAGLAESALVVERDPAAAAYIDALNDSHLVRDLMDGNLEWEWTSMRMISDDPAKILGQLPPDAALPAKLDQFLGRPAKAVDLISPYVVPGPAGTDFLVTLAAQGVKIRVLTNSLEATDVAIVHGGYAKWRKPLLKAGITLYELRRLSTNPGERQMTGPFGSSTSSLHAKTSAVDQSRVVVGSFNFDPRSAHLNTEMGFVIDSPALAQKIVAAFDSSIPAKAYQVHLTENEDLYWIEHQQDEVVRHDTEPGTSVWHRVGVWFVSLLPIDWLL